MASAQDSTTSPDINNISAWTQADYTLLNSDIIQSLSSAQIQQMQHPDWMPASAAAGFSAEKLAGINISLSWFSAAWLNYLPLAAFQALDSSRLGQISAATWAQIDNAHITALTPTQIGVVGQRAVLSSAQFALLDLTAVSPTAMASWGQSSWAGTTAAQMSLLTKAQIDAMQNATWLPLSAVSGIQPSQVLVFTTNYSRFNGAWFNQMRLDSFQALDNSRLAQISAATWTQIDKAHFSALNATQMSVIKLDFSAIAVDWISSLTPEVFQGLTATQLGQFNASAIAGISDSCLGTLTPTQLTALHDLSQLSAHQFSLLSLSAMSSAQIAAWTPDQYATITPAEFSSLTTAQIGAMTNPAALPLNVVSALTVAQVNAINTDFSLLPDSWLNSLSTTALQGLTPYQFSHLSSLTPAEVNNITSLAALSSAQFSQLNLTGLSTSAIAGWVNSEYAGLTAQQISSLSNAQIHAMQHADWMPAAAATGFTAEKLASLAISFYWFSSGWLNNLNISTFQSMTATQLNQISTSTLSALDNAHLTALSAAQVASMNNLGSLPRGKFGILNISALSASQLGSLTRTQYQGLTQAQFNTLNATQVQALTHPEWLQPGLLNNLSLTQFQSMTAAQFAALTPAAISNLDAAHLACYVGDLTTLSNDTLLSIESRLTAAQRSTLTASQQSLVALNQSTEQSLISSLSDMGLKNIMQSLDAGGESLFSFRTIESVMKSFAGGLTDGLSATQYSDLNGYLQDIGQVQGSTSSIYSLVNGMVTGANGASVQWVSPTDGSFTRIGSLNVGSSATQFNQLISTWLDGADTPVSSSTSHVDGRPLFANGMPTINDIHQGGIGDCWVLSAFQAVVNTSPEFIKSMVVQNSNDTYSVRFFNNGATDWVNVDSNVCSYGESSSSSSWAAIYERAYLQYRSTYTGADNTYSFLNGGLWDPLKAMTGDDITAYYAPAESEWNTTVFTALKTAVANHQPAEIASFQNSKDPVNGYTNFVSGHMLAITGFDESTDKFTITNPWGADSTSGFNGTFEATMDEMWENGHSYVAWANSAGATGIAGQLVTAMASIAPTPAASSISSLYQATAANTALLVTAHA